MATDCASEHQLHIARTEVANVLEAMPAGRLKTLYANALSERLSRRPDDDGRSSDMDYFLARCGELRDVDGSILVTGGRLSQVLVGDGGFYVKYCWRNTFAWGCTPDGTRTPVTEWMQNIHDSKTTIQLIQARGIYGFGATWSVALDVMLLYRLIDTGVITNAKLIATTVYATSLEVEWFDDPAERAYILSRATTTDDSPYNATEIWVSSSRTLLNLFPGG